MSIHVLSPQVVSKIAAGEVVERPASVVKELLENSLDAGATQISIEVSGGGVAIIRVTDNGAGIAADEVEVAFERHATSKIASEADIETIGTLGFRGEALPTIASVADMSMVTRHRDDTAGTAIQLEDGIVVSKGKQGCPPGTTMTVRNLFRSVPARLKFLKSTSTESGHISHMVTQYALAFPEVKFDLVLNGRTALRSPGNGNLRDAVTDAYGLEIGKAMLEAFPSEASEAQSIEVSGLVSPPSVSRSNRNYLSFFVNRRWVQSRALTFAVEEAYQGMLMTGKHPIVILNISLPPGDIDVNVHPTKREIKFRREGDVFLAIQRVVRETLVGSGPVPTLKRSFVPTAASGPSSLSMFDALKSSHPRPAAPQPALRTTEEPVLPVPQLPILRVIGQLQNTYVLAEGPDGMYLIDQHAAHERIMFEQVREQQARRALEVQGLLEPMTIEVTARQDAVLSAHMAAMTETGFTLEPFGERSYLLRAIPAVLRSSDVAQVLTEIVDALNEEHTTDWRERSAISLACHSAIKAGQVLGQDEMEELVRQLEQATMPRSCPHGRPTMIHLSASQLESEFGRR